MTQRGGGEDSGSQMDANQNVSVVLMNWRDLIHPQAGGSEIVADRILRGLQSRGFNATLVCGGPVGKRDYQVMRAGGTYSQYFIGPILVLWRLRSSQVVIDVENGFPFFSPLWWRKNRILLVHHVHTDQWHDQFPRPLSRLFSWIESKVMPYVYRNTPVIAVSESTRKDLENLGFASQQISVIESGVDLTASDLEDDGGSADPIYLCLGRLVPHKRVDLVILAWRRVAVERPGTLIVVGDGPESDRIRLLVQGSERCKWLGRVDEEVKVQLLHEAALHVTATRHEGWGMTVMEAAVGGTPTLGVRVQGVQDSVQHLETGFLVEPARGDSNLVDELVEAWLELSSNAELLLQLGRNARARAEVRSWEGTVDAWERTIFSTSSMGGNFRR